MKLTQGARKSVIVPNMDSDIVSLLCVRTFRQYLQYQGYAFRRYCPFCEANEAVLAENEGWRLLKNPFPYKHTISHSILTPKRHVTSFDQLSPEEWEQYGLLVAYACGQLCGALVTRFGDDPRKSNASLRHLHTNVLIPDGTGPVRPWVAKEGHIYQEQKQVLEIFEWLRLQMESEVSLETALAQLSPKEQQLIADRM